MSNYRTITDEEKGIQRMNSGGSHPYHSSLTPLLDSDTPISGTPILSSITQQSKVPANKSDHATSKSKKSSIIYIIIFGAVNSIMAIPCLFGYAAVIFNNEAFGPYINTLSKVVLWSSMIHQFCFMTFSSLNFAIGQVQDAGLIFLSHMANTMANSIIDEGGTSEEIISTALVILTLATFFTGIVLVLMGKFRLADLVSYLPLPVVGGYLAFIGYFCLQAGVSLCISKAMIRLADWAYLWNERESLLALPGILAGVAFTVVSRTVQHDAALPLLMVVLPASFYMILFSLGLGMDQARDYGWIGEESPPVPFTDLFKLVDFSKVHWMLAFECASTWLGMVFVVSFSSCLDVAAISLDMGEALDVNNELTTVGLSNTISGALMGFTGSYIFSQTIFTCRTGTNTRLVGLFVALSELAIILSPINVLEVVPLFFLGSTLIFIGVDLLYEWLIEIRHRILLSEYVVLLFTFCCIHILGINFGIVLGVVISVVDYVFKTARVSSISKVWKRSRAVWRPEQWKLLQSHGYHLQNPKIVTFEIKGAVFFGSSLQLLQTMTEELSLNSTEAVVVQMALVSPGRHHAQPSPSARQTLSQLREERKSRVHKETRPPGVRIKPRFVVLDLAQVPNVDSSAARGCFYQLSKMCARSNIVLCASGATPRVNWVLRSHDAAYSLPEEDEAKSKASDRLQVTDKIILFDTVYEALEFAEVTLLSELQPLTTGRLLLEPKVPHGASSAPKANVREDRVTLKDAFVNILGLKTEEEEALAAFAKKRGPFHEEVEYHSGEAIFQEGSQPDSFFVLLRGSVALFRDLSTRSLSEPNIFSGAGQVESKRRSALGDVETFVPPGGIFGFVDFVLEQPWLFSAVAAKDKTVVAKLSRDGLERLKDESPELDRIVNRVLLKVSIMELANTTEL